MKDCGQQQLPAARAELLQTVLMTPVTEAYAALVEADDVPAGDFTLMMLHDVSLSGMSMPLRTFFAAWGIKPEVPTPDEVKAPSLARQSHALGLTFRKYGAIGPYDPKQCAEYKARYQQMANPEGSGSDRAIESLMDIIHNNKKLLQTSIVGNRYGQGNQREYILKVHEMVYYYYWCSDYRGNRVPQDYPNRYYPPYNEPGEGDGSGSSSAQSGGGAGSSGGSSSGPSWGESG